jgi:hypothetical protein
MLDSSRSLRVDHRLPTFPVHQPYELTGSDAAAIALDVQRESLLLVYPGTDRQVSEGIALRTMELDANFRLGGIALCTNSPNTEDD